MTVPGDLGQIDAGDGDPSIGASNALASLSVKSMGLFGKATQRSPASLNSDINGPLGTLTVATDFGRVQLTVDATSEPDGTIGSTTIGGLFEGSILTAGNVGSVKITGDIAGGAILCSAKLSTLSVGGSVFGNMDGPGGSIIAGELGTVTIGRDLVAGDKSETGKIDSIRKLGSVTIGGSIIGGSGDENTFAIGGVTQAGQIFAGGDLGPVKVGHDIRGGSGDASAKIVTRGKLASLTVGGSIIGGSGDYTSTDIDDGQIFSVSDMGPVNIGHDVLGGAGPSSGLILSDGKLTSATIGGTNSKTGFISGLHLGNLSIGGSVVGGSGDFSGYIHSDTDIASLTIGHNFVGGTVSGSASLDSSGLIEAQGRIGSLTIKGSIIAGLDDSTGTLTNSADIRASDDIGALTIQGSVIGHGDAGKGASLVVISARGQHQPLAAGATTDVAIARMNVGGRVEYANILAGFDRDHMMSPAVLVASNADAQIGAVTVGSDWIASNLVAGAMNDAGTSGTTDDNINFGDFNDRPIAGGTAIVSKIASISIAGQAFGSPASENPMDHFGFVAEQIGALTIGSRTFTLNAGISNDGRIAGATNDITLHEVNALIGSTSPFPSSAKLIDASTVTYTDTDDDKVTVKLSKPLLNAGNVNNVFKFDTGMVNDGVPARQQLQLIDLAALLTNNVGVTVTAMRAGNGDGLANVGAVTFTGYNAAAISLPGDVGQVAGGANTAGTPGLASLSVRSMGRLGLDTQPAAFGGFTPRLGGEINGGLGSLTVRQDIIGANIDVSGAIGPVNLGGSLIGAGAMNSGLIAATTSIGPVSIGDEIEGATGQGSGRIFSQLSIASLVLGGSLLGGAGDGSGKVSVVPTTGTVGTLGLVRIAHDLIGGFGFGAGQITSGDSTPVPPVAGNITSVIISGSILGGGNTSSGLVFATGNLGTMTIAHDLSGGLGANSGQVSAFGNITGVMLGGSLVGGGNGNTGRIVSAGDLGTVGVGHDLLGGPIGPSATITSGGKLGPVTIAGSVLGGAGSTTATIVSKGDMAAVNVGGNLQGGGGADSGRIAVGDPTAMPAIKSKIASVTLGGSLLGGANLEAGRIYPTGVLGPVRIGGNLAGGSGQHAGSIFTDDKAGDITLGGSLLGGSADSSGEMIAVVGFGAVTVGGDVAGGSGNYTGRIGAENKVASITIHGTLVGGSNNTSANLTSTGVIDTSNDIGLLMIDGNVIGGSVSSTGTLGGSGYVESHGRIVNVMIGGSIVSGADHSNSVDQFQNASIRATLDIPTFTVNGSLLGNATSMGLSPVIISADGEDGHAFFNFAFRTIAVNGSVERATIFGDYPPNLSPDVANAQIGMVKVGRNWIASNVVVGVVNQGDDSSPGGSGTAADNVNFGDAYDFPLALGPISHRITNVVIGGNVAGTEATGDHFGFTAAAIGSFKYAGFSAPTYTGPLQLSLPTGDVTVHEA